MRSCGSDCLPDWLAFVAAQVVEHHDVARLQRGDEELGYPGQEQATIDGAVEHARRGDAGCTQASQKGHRRPACMRHGGDEALATQRTAMRACHVGGCPVDLLRSSTVDKDQVHRINPTLVALPS